MKLSILGGGFGIYGYLPAACSLGWEVTTLSKYKEQIYSRKELSNFYDDIQFVKSESELLDFNFPIVFARAPRMQFEFLVEILKSSVGPSYFFLEKPLTNSISNSEIILKALKNSKKSFSIGYLFQFTDWFIDLSNMLTDKGKMITINWRIPFTNKTWKNDPTEGGGIYSFFLVHFVPVLIKLGFKISDMEIKYMNEQFTLKCVGDNYVTINAKIVSENYGFQLLVDTMPEPLFQSQTPFGIKPQPGSIDQRIEPLKRYLKIALGESALSDSSVETELKVIEFLKLCSKLRNI